MARARLLALALLAVAWPAGAQVTSQDELPSFTLRAQAFASYAGSFTAAGDSLLQSHQLSEGFSTDLSGWIWDSRYVKFRSFLLVMHLDLLRPHRSGPYSFGYGTSLRLMSRSILPITLSGMRGLTLPGSTAEAVQPATTTTLSANAQLVSPLLPKLELQAQRMISETPDQPRYLSDAFSGAVHGESSLHRYAGIASWSQQRTGDQVPTGALLASVADDLYPGRDTSARLQASVAQGRGFGGAQEEGFTGYQTSATLLSRLAANTVMRTAYSFSGAGASDRDQVSNALSAGATIDLRPFPLLLGEGAAATYSTIAAPGLKRTLATASAAQGLATFARVGLVELGCSVNGQAGYSEVSDGHPGVLLGFGANANAQGPLAGVPLRGAVSYSRREDESSAGQSSRTFHASLSSLLASSRLMLLPALNYAWLAQTDPVNPGAWLSNSSANLLITGAAPVWRTQVTFAGGWAEGWSNQPGTRATGSLFAHAATALSLGPGRFGNLAADLTHTLGGGTSASVLCSAVWAFRESSLSFNYAYTRSFPSDGGSHSVSVLFSRSMRTSFLPEHQ